MANSCIPGYDEALSLERKIREEAFLREFDTICGIKVHHVTPFLLARLFRMNTPFLTNGAKYSTAETIRFLWSISLDFSEDATVREAFVEETTKRLADMEDGFLKAEEEIDEYLTATFMDSPEGGAASVPYVCSIAWIVTFMATADGFHWDEQRTLHTPLRRIYQYMRCMERRKGTIMHNSISDKVSADWQLQLQEDWHKAHGGRN